MALPLARSVSAARIGYPIVPFAAVGAEECYDIVLDAGDVLSVPIIGDVLKRFVPRADVMPPVVAGAGLSPLPRPERCYFWFGDAIETKPYQARRDGRDTHMMVRELVRHAVEDGIEQLLEEREQDPDRKLLARFLHGHLA